MNCCRGPPPQVQKTAGGLPAPIASWIFCLYDWFSTKSMVMWSPGWLLSKDAARFCTAVLAGLGPVVTSHIVTVVPFELLLPDDALPPPAADPHAASASTPAVAAAATINRPWPAARHAERLPVSAMISSRPPGAPEPKRISEISRNISEGGCNTREAPNGGQPIVSVML